MTIFNIQKDLRKLASKEKAKFFPRFFKAGKGEYAEGDVFIGVTVPNCRIIAKRYSVLPLKEIQKLIRSKIHEERLATLLILIEQFKKGDEADRKKIYDFYLKNTKYINNWDLVDLSAGYIVGNYLTDKPRDVLYKLAKSKILWERRIAIVSTFAFLRKNEIEDTLKISTILLNDKHDLIHKATGWLLREVGKKSQKDLVKYLKKHYRKMPRTMLRYSIEKFPEKVRRAYIEGKT